MIIKAKMERIFLGILIILFLFACSGPKKAVTVTHIDSDTIAADSVEYDLETFDNKFEVWYEMHKSPSMFRSKEYYEGWNRRYVTSWNINAISGKNNFFFEPIIGYDPNTDYGFELNHELFHYFQYVEHVLKIEIIPGGGPRTVNY